MVIAGVLLVLAGLTGVFYGVAINVPGMMTRGATDYSFITAYITEWISCINRRFSPYDGWCQTESLSLG